MEQSPESNPPETDKSGAITEATLGAVLREARERLGLSVADVANQIKFAPRQIDAIESGDYQQLPEEAFLRGFIRSYAKILQLDAQKLLAALPHSKTATMELVIPASVGVPFPNAHSLPRQNMILLAAAGVLAVIAGAFALWNFMSPIKHPQVAQVETPVSLPAEEQAAPAAPAPDVRESSAAPANTPKVKSKPESVQPEAGSQTRTAVKPVEKPLLMLGLNPEVKPLAPTKVKPEAKPVAPQQTMSATSETQSGDSVKVTQLRLEFGEESWTEIRDRDDKILSSKVNPAGSELVVYGRAPFTMLIGHGLSARLYHQGKQIDLAPYINKYSEVAHVTLQ
ncbi:MAG: RodZ domain-containing protein [Pseudomonadota bacterium]